MKRKYNLHVEREIAISHKLIHHEGKCRNLHGHNLKVIVDIEALGLIKSGSSMNMVMDFGDIKQIIDNLDHKHLNNHFGELTLLAEQPTSEILCNYLCEEISLKANNKLITSIKVTIYEATGQYASFEMECEQ